jgi:hypothetical protein
MHLRWEDRAYSGFNYNLRYDRAGRRYEPGVGLELRDNYFRLGDRIGYGWVLGESSSIQRHRLNLEGEIYVRNAGGTLQSLELGPEWEMATNAGHSLILEATRRVEDLREAFALPEGVRVPAGRYAFYNGEISYGMPSGRDLRTDVEVIGGSFYDGWRAILEVSPTWSLPLPAGQRLLSAESNRISGPQPTTYCPCRASSRRGYSERRVFDLGVCSV